MKKFWICIIFFALVSCNASSSQLSATSTLLPTETITPTPLPVVIPTSTFIPSPTFTPSPVWTPLPTIPPEDVQDTILNWIETNRGCHYPCWWGITPGETDWNSAKAFLYTISPQMWVPDSRDFVQVIFPLPDNWFYDAKGNVYFYINDGIVESILAFTDIPLAEFFSVYGMPAEIRVAYTPYEIMPFYSYCIALNYPTRGITLLFCEEVYQDDGNRICPYHSFEIETLVDGSGKKHVIDHLTIGLILWNPEYQLSVDDVLFRYRRALVNSVEFKPLEQITNLTAQEFLEIISDRNNRTCIEIKK